VTGFPVELLLSPPVLALLGLCVGSFLNVVIHRLPLSTERQWWADMADQLGDAASWKRVFASREEPPAAQRQTAERLATRAPRDAVLVAESGIRSPADVRRMTAAGAHAVLVGEAFMERPDPGAALAEWMRCR